MVIIYQQIMTVVVGLMGFLSTAATEPEFDAHSDPDITACGETPQARELARMLLHHPQQQRDELRCNATLSGIAQRKAREMAQLKVVNHMGRSSANWRLIDAGYPLASIYPRDMSNQVEAVAGGPESAPLMLDQFLRSKNHRSHLLAEHPFYLLQNELGVGYYYDWHSPHIHYWVVYLAHQQEKPLASDIAPSKD